MGNVIFESGEMPRVMSLRDLIRLLRREGAKCRDIAMGMNYG